jgi:hypothetical protein
MELVKYCGLQCCLALTGSKFINAHQKRGVYIYKNAEVKLIKTSAAVWFNKIFGFHQLKMAT